MKKTFLTIYLTLFFLAAYAQVQRMMIPAGEYAVGSGSKIPSFCIDKGLDAPLPSDRFIRSSSNIFVSRTIGNNTVRRPLSQVNGTWVRITGSNDGMNYLNIVPVNTDGGAIYKLLVVGGPAILANRTTQSVTQNIPNHALLNSAQERINGMQDADIATYVMQSAVWKINSGESRTDIDRYLDEVVGLKEDIRRLDVITDPKTRKEKKENVIFQLEIGYPLERIREKITAQVDDHLLNNKLTAFFSNDVDQVYELVSNGVDKKTLGILVDNGLIKLTNGVLDEKSKNLLNELTEANKKINAYRLYCCESLFQNIKKVQADNGLPETGIPSVELNKRLSEYGKPFDIIEDYYRGKTDNVLATDHTNYIMEFGEQRYMFSERQGLKPLTATLIENVEASFRERVRYHSDNTIAFLNLSAVNTATGEINFQLAGTAGKTVWTDQNSFNQIIASLDAELTRIDDNTKIVLAKDMFTRGKLGFFDKGPESELYGTKKLTRSYVEGKEWINYTELLRELQKKYPAKKFYLGGDFYYDKTAGTFKVKDGSDVAAYIHPESVPIELDQVAAMKSRLSSAGITVHHLNEELAVPEKVRQANILLLSGHRNENFETYLKQLAEKNLLRGKIVAVFSCNERGVAVLNSHLIRKGGARKVIFFPSKIDADAVNAVFSELSELTKSISPGKDYDFDELIRQAIKKAQENPKYQDLQEHIKLLIDLIEQTSRKTKQPVNHGDA